jgi:hypothetical protein
VGTIEARQEPRSPEPQQGVFCCMLQKEPQAQESGPGPDTYRKPHEEFLSISVLGEFCKKMIVYLCITCKIVIFLNSKIFKATLLSHP